MPKSKRRKRFERHPMVDALDEFLQTPAGAACLSPGAHGVYLENRIKAAFHEGWAAHERHVAPKPARRRAQEKK